MEKRKKFLTRLKNLFINKTAKSLRLINTIDISLCLRLKADDNLFLVLFTAALLTP
uniref:Uncharacterized protein n=1 Tax=Anguilla anguilla TaxID=7936 RepID=A0A0E9QN92_ANGAN